ncbi:MAG: acyl-CoA dehydrogenase [Streptosporangiales bacterium]|nr:acyl-CoA dehydrogenase [Streptosporangiales bacterium]
MSLLYSDLQEELRGSVRALLADRCPPSAVLARVETDTPYDLDLWRALTTEIGVAGLLIPESLGGAGATPGEAAVVLEELGRSCAPVPYLTSSVLATTLLLRSGTPAAEKLLADLASGASTAAVAVSLATSPYDVKSSGVTVTADGLTGTVTGVAGAEPADVVLVPADGKIHAVTDFTVHTQVSLDQTRPIATIELDSARSTRIAPDTEPLTYALSRTAALLASEQVGVAEWCFDTTLAYVKERKQFARPIGSYQAIKHRLADLWLDIAKARATARNAAEDDPDEITIAVAQAWTSPVTVHAAEECVQLHGGIGMTWEHPAHLYLKRAKADSIALGTQGDHQDTLAKAANIPATPHGTGH